MKQVVAFSSFANGPLPGNGVVHGFAVLFEPRAQRLQPIHLHGRKGPIVFRSYVQQQVAVLAYNVNQEGDQIGGGNSLCLALGAVIPERPPLAAARTRQRNKEPERYA